MQRTRSKSATRTPISPKRKAPTIDPDIIEISDDSEEETQPKVTKRSRTSKLQRSSSKSTNIKSKSKLRNTVVRNDNNDVLVISDGESEPTASSSGRSALLEDLLGQIQRLEKENETLRRDKAESDLALAKEKTRPDPAKLLMDKGELDDITTCEICSDRMWHPVILPDCGHAFCQKCLQDWFSQTLARHMQTHPHYGGPTPLPSFVLECLAAPQLSRHPQMALILQQWVQTLPPRPAYTCPSCRQPCKTRPANDYPLKKVVCMTARVMGEGNGPSTASAQGKGTPMNDPWSGFFPLPLR